MAEGEGRRRKRFALAAVLTIVVALVAILAGRPQPPPGSGTGAASRESDPDGSLVVPRPGDEAVAIPRGPREVDREDEVLCHGHVLEAGTGRPVQGAAVVLTRGDGRRETRTARDGGWRLTAPRPGLVASTWIRLHVRASAAGYLPVGSPLSVPAGARTWRTPTLLLERAGALVRGRVVDAEGRGIAGAKVGPSTTDEEGRFEEFAVGLGRVRIRATAFGWLPGHTELRVHPAADLPRHEVEIVLARSETIAAVVVDDLGRPVADAEILDPVRGPVRMRSDAKGRFAWPADLDGMARVTVRKVGHLNLPQKHDLAPGAANRVVLARARVLAGRLLHADGSPAAGLRVRAWFEWPYVTHDLVGADGRFRLDPVPYDAFVIRAYHHGVEVGVLPVAAGGDRDDLELRLPSLLRQPVLVVDASTGAPLESATVAGINDPDRARTDASGRAEILVSPRVGVRDGLQVGRAGYATRSVSVPGPLSGDPIRIELSPRVRVRLRVTDPGGRPIPHAVASWRGAWPDHRSTATTDAEGVAVLDLVAQDALEVFVTHATYGRIRIAVDGRRDGAEREVVLGAEYAERTYEVVDADGTPMPGAYVNQRGRILPAAEDGTIRVLVGLGESIRVAAPGRRSVAYPPLQPAQIGTVSRERVELPPVAVIHGRVVDAAGRPVTGVRVGIWSADVAVDGRGRFEIRAEAGRVAPVVLEDPVLDMEVDSRWGLPGGDEIVLVSPGRGRLRLRPTIELPEDPEDCSCIGQVLLLDRREPEEGHCIAGLREMEWDGHAFSGRVPAGRIRVRFALEGLDGGCVREIVVPEGGEVEIPMGAWPRETLSGSVRGPDGKPAAGSIHDALNGEHVAEIGRDGALRLSRADAPRGVVHLVVMSSTHAARVLDPVDLTAGPDLRIRLSRGGRVRLRVLREDGTPVKARAVLWLPPVCEDEFATDGDGVVVLERVPAGRRTIEIRRSDMLPVRREVEVRDGEVTELEVRLPGDNRSDARPRR